MKIYYLYLIIKLFYFILYHLLFHFNYLLYNCLGVLIFFHLYLYIQIIINIQEIQVFMITSYFIFRGYLNLYFIYLIIIFMFGFLYHWRFLFFIIYYYYLLLLLSKNYICQYNFQVNVNFNYLDFFYIYVIFKYLGPFMISNFYLILYNIYND
jgi:hypothetical protein